jgi:hypothetical protein
MNLENIDVQLVNTGKTKLESSMGRQEFSTRDLPHCRVHVDPKPRNRP